MISIDVFVKVWISVVGSKPTREQMETTLKAAETNKAEYFPISLKNMERVILYALCLQNSLPHLTES